ncbi:CCA tRNA nucleotidyltransferase [bacterium]|nr:CCA tRNA nucleotidyltransferase [bacterium]
MDIIKINDKSHKLYYVGGIVRDELLGFESLDIDLVYEGNAIDFAKNSGLEILQINEPFGTVRVLIDGREYDIASTREEIYPKKGHLPQVQNIAVSLCKDVKRRDFTINSLYKSLSTGEIIDFTGGIEDLKNKKLKVLHKKSFIDDPTRIIRALKFRMRFGFELDDTTRQLQEEYLSNINYDMCYKRVKKELMDTFNAKNIPFETLENTFKIFINEGIYKLVTGTLPPVAFCDNLPPASLPLKHQWLIFAGRLKDLSRLALTRGEQKILDDLKNLQNSEFKTDLEIYKAFTPCAPETILLYGILQDKKIILHYLNNLKDIKLEISGDDLIQLGLKPSAKFQEIFDYVLSEKFKNPKMAKEKELECAKSFISQ